MKKNVLLIVIDALCSRVVVPAIESGKLPTMQRLRDHGVLREHCTSIFPSITPSATAAIVTGRYPSHHGIAGNFWYDRDHESVAYYGDDFSVIFNAGFGKFFNDYLVRLNFQRLQCDTLYETVERAGLSAAALNYMWFRGEVDHEVNAPLMLELLPGVKAVDRIRGPRVLGLADFARSQKPGTDRPLQASGGVTRRFGFHDETTAEYLLDLAEADPFPDFTLAYFPNNDFDSHKVGPDNALPTVQDVDAHLKEFFDCHGGLERFLSSGAVVIVGDHSQSDLDSDASRRGIDLSELLADLRLATPGSSWADGDQLMICPNMRAAQIYVRGHDDAVTASIVERLLPESRIDQVIWRSNDDTFHVATSDRGHLCFRPSRSADGIVDCYGNRWEYSGELSAIDAAVDSEMQVAYGTYPNAMERIAGGFTEVSGDLWVTARLGHEFRVPETHISESGSHGSLHRDDSFSCLLVAGIDDDTIVPAHPRITDVAPMCLKILGVE